MGAPGQVSGAFVLVRAALSIVAATGLTAAVPPPAPAARDLRHVVRALDAGGPPTRRTLERLLGPLRCGASACSGGPLRLRCTVIKAVCFQRFDGGSLLVLDPLAGVCLRPEAVAPPMAALGPAHNSCTDGVTCLYRAAIRPWETLSLGVSGSGRSACVQSVVFERRTRLHAPTARQS